ncbi:MAG: hypothetical protein ACRC5R_02775, partial [Mycoplasmatales bacterium]
MNKKIIIILISVVVFVLAIILGVSVYKNVRFNNITDFYAEAGGITDEAEKTKLKEEIKKNYEEISSKFEAIKELYSKEQALLANTKPAVPEIIVNENPIATIDVEGYGTMTFELFAN